MIIPIRRQWLVICCGLLAVALLPGTARGQVSKSEPLAKELAQLLQRAQLDSIAAKDPAESDQYVAALLFSGSQLLVVSARYAVPVLLDARIRDREFRDVYIDLNSASIKDSKTFVSDLLADGLRARPRENQPFDTYESAETSRAFDGDWRKAKISEADYLKAFEEADTQYARMLTILLGELRKSG